MNIQGFYTGREFDADTFFGAHPYEGGTHFAVWAPSARDVKVITSGLSDGAAFCPGTYTLRTRSCLGQQTA